MVLEHHQRVLNMSRMDEGVQTALIMRYEMRWRRTRNAMQAGRAVSVDRSEMS